LNNYVVGKFNKNKNLKNDRKPECILGKVGKLAMSRVVG